MLFVHIVSINNKYLFFFYFDLHINSANAIPIIIPDKGLYENISKLDALEDTLDVESIF